jgi:DnaJ domain
MDDSKDYYAVLGVLPSAEADVIRATYRALANRYHPDKRAGEKSQAEIRMRELNAAYEILSDEQKRWAYDERRRDAVRSRTGWDPYSGFDEAAKTSAEQAEARNQSSRWDSSAAIKPQRNTRAKLGGAVLATIGSFLGVIVMGALISQGQKSFNWGLLALPCIVLIAGLAKIGKRQRLGSDQGPGLGDNPINENGKTGARADEPSSAKASMPAGWIVSVLAGLAIFMGLIAFNHLPNPGHGSRFRLALSQRPRLPLSKRTLRVRSRGPT